MFVTRRRFNKLKDKAEVAALAVVTANITLDINNKSLTAAESALEHKDWQIEKLQDDLYRMHDHMMYVREVMADLP